MRQLSLAVSLSDRTWPIVSGLEALPDVKFQFENLSVEEIFEKQVQTACFDVSELSLASYLIGLGDGDKRLTAIPVFLSRSFRHNALYVRSDSQLTKLKDLAGKRVGLPEYQMTAAVWIRELIASECGLDTLQSIHWVTYRPERRPIDISLERGEAVSLFAGLLDGEVDAIMAARRPPAEYFGSGGEAKGVRRLLPDVWTAERNYYKKTGNFPIMHLISIKSEVVNANPVLPAQLFELFNSVRQRSLNGLAETVYLRSSLPWGVKNFEETAQVMGNELWTYGLQSNWNYIEQFMSQLVRDTLLPRVLMPEEVFHPDTVSY